MRKGIFVLGAALAVLAGSQAVEAQGDSGQKRPPGDGGQHGMQRQMGGLNPSAVLFKGIELTKEQQEKIDSINAKYGKAMRGNRTAVGSEARGGMMRGKDGAKTSDSSRRGAGEKGERPRYEGGARGDSIRWGSRPQGARGDSARAVPHSDKSKADSSKEAPRSLQGFRGPMNEDMEKEILNVLTESQRVIFKQNQKELAEKMKQMMNGRGGDQRVAPPSRPSNR